MEELLKLKIKPKPFSTAIILVLTIAVSLLAMPATNAHSPAWQIPTYAYIAVTPNPVGTGQSVFVVMWLDLVPPTAGGATGDRWGNFTITITKPDGTTDHLGPFVSDATSSAYTSYVPNQVGTYNFVFSFPGQTLHLNSPINGLPGTPSDNVGDYYQASTASQTLTVQQQSILTYPSYPLPTQYWTRPIEGENTAWDTVASNWLNSPQIAPSMPGSVGKVQPNGIAPNSPHVMWTKPLVAGGVAGGTYASSAGMTFYSGLSYEAKFGTRIIMNGNLYYPLALGDSPTGAGYVCVDLRTGQQLWWQNFTFNPSFGQLYDYESPNQHGVIPNGYLWSSSGTTRIAYDPMTGLWVFTLTKVPSSTTANTAYGPNGEILVYELNYAKRWLALWNNTAATYNGTDTKTPGETLGAGVESGTNYWQWRPVGKVVDSSTAYSWNATIPNLPGNSQPSIVKVIVGDLMLGTSSTLSATTSYGTPDPYTYWAISLKPGSLGQLLWIKDYTAPAGNTTLVQGPTSTEARVFTLYEKETMTWSGYNLDTGAKLWGPVGTRTATAFDYYGYLTNYGVEAAYGNLYVSSYGGHLDCYDMKNGNLLWTYGKGDAGNSTNSGLETPWGNYPQVIGAIADGKVYIYNSEHSPNSPQYLGSRVRCIDAYTGKELWTMLGWGSVGTGSSGSFAVADGYLTYLNTYDNQIYVVGRGPSATTVTASPKVSVRGNGVLLEGTVTDTAAGTKQNEQAARFPNGVPAVSDDSQGAWMEYVYMQKPMINNVTGVNVHLTAFDPNGNIEDLGNATSDASGNYALQWTPPVPGLYKITATFEGSNSYWPSTAETAISVTEAPSASVAPTQTPTASTPPTTATPSPIVTSTPTSAPPPNAQTPITLYAGIAAAVIIIAVVAAAIALRRRK